MKIWYPSKLRDFLIQLLLKRLLTFSKISNTSKSQLSLDLVEMEERMVLAPFSSKMKKNLKKLWKK